jgi:threonylcarbamoyladenosine tRNA methylthiotransferase MtaB
VLTGIHLGHYGIDLSRGKPRSDWCRLWNLIERLDHLSGDFRIRLSSLEAAEVRDDLVSAIAGSRRVVPHLHLCLQSGSDSVLERMKRRYRRAGFVERCQRIREALDLPAFTTDVIVGFPGETDADFEATCEVVREVGFSKVHVFSWSPRRGTPAAMLTGRVPPEVVAQRREHLRTLADELASNYRRQLVGRRLDVLVEGADPTRVGNVRGTSCRYASVTFEAHASALIGECVPVRVVAVANDGLLGRPEPDKAPAATAKTSTAERWSLPLLGFADL